ncbi:MAG: hypothetical protein ACOC1U_04900 [Spirochaetota bacterium]
MKRILIAAIALLIVAAGAFAQMGGHGRYGKKDGPYRAQAEEIMSDYDDRVPSELTFGEIEELAGRLSIPAQKAAFVGFSRVASMIAPGVGQFLNKDYLGGSLFALGDLTIKAGTLVGIYFLLPPEVRFDQLNYYTAPKSQIASTWESAVNGMSLEDTLPIVGVAAGGALLSSILGQFAGAHAAGLARDRIASGEIEFEPRPQMMMIGGRLGVGVRMGF